MSASKTKVHCESCKAVPSMNAAAKRSLYFAATQLRSRIHAKRRATNDAKPFPQKGKATPRPFASRKCHKTNGHQAARQKCQKKRFPAQAQNGITADSRTRFLSKIVVSRLVANVKKKKSLSQNGGATPLMPVACKYKKNK